MAERATVFQTSQIGVETTPGNSVAALRRLSSMSFDVGIQTNVDLFRPSGQKFPTVASPGKEWTGFKLTGKPTYTELMYAYASVLKNVSPTVLSGSAQSWVFAPNPLAADAFATYTLEQGDPTSRAHRVTHLLFDAFGMEITREAINLSGGGIAQRLTDNVQLSTNEVQTVTITGTPTGGTFTLTYSGQTTTGIAYNANAAAVQAALEALSNIGVGDVSVTGGPGPGTPYLVEFRGTLAQTNVAQMTASGSFTGGSSPAVAVTTTTPGVAPTELALLPILPTQTSIYLADTQAGLAGASALTRALMVGFDISNRYGGVWPINAANTSFAAVVEMPPAGKAKLLMEADTEGMALLTQLRAGSSKFMRINSVGDAIPSGGGNTYLHRVELALKVTGVSEFKDEDGVFAIEWSFDIVKDATWGKAIEVTLQNDIASL